jgi:hypothetical protein
MVHTSDLMHQSLYRVWNLLTDTQIQPCSFDIFIHTCDKVHLPFLLARFPLSQSENYEKARQVRNSYLFLLVVFIV